MFTLRNKLVTSLKYRTFTSCNMNEIIKDSKRIFLQAVLAVEPRTLIKNNVTVINNKLFVCGNEYNIDKNCYVVGFGKAVLAMSKEIECILGSHLVKGIVSVPAGISSSRLGHENALTGQSIEQLFEKAREEHSADTGVHPAQSKIKYLEGADNNLPDAAAEQTARAIFELAGRLNEGDLLIVLISGGGSALLPLPRPPVTLQEKTDLIKLLSRRGADILELNCVRKRLSVVKGGGLALQAHPATVLALVLSDVIGDPLDYIASGPTAPANDAPDAAAQIIAKYDLHDQIPLSVQKLLSERDTSCPRTLNHVTNVVIGNNSRAAAAAAAAAKGLGYETHIISTAVSGDVGAVSAMYARLAVEIVSLMRSGSSVEQVRNCLRRYKRVLNISDDRINEKFSAQDKLGGRVCLVGGGEPTVRVRGGGTGGRNQQLALQFAIDVNNELQSANACAEPMNISLLSCGTDGIDGPTDAAGAIGTNSLCRLAQQEHLAPRAYVEDNDCYEFYRRFQDGLYLVRTGHTGTNVMDIHVLMINRKN